MPKQTNSTEDQDFCEQLPYMGLNIDLGKVFEYIVDNYSPEDIFDENELIAWAKYQPIENIANEESLMQWGYENREYFKEEE
jgi:hypothetical protein